ncbi:hypothetical protein K435DRAFT_853298 [Dendrothele bispora CBS 962.96]|uniref:Uncharacterized protein n=1 Tax=Dendrothele bispora (strain CBS 962.96) TaxID=1314807 RepID=A0A4S8MHQ6_DENBC|nr:hypothetical protein K435DRAFT_853298 [Dendrothele bispora CBS 962.96]
MMLVHKQLPQFSLPSSQYSHRRHPSAPPPSAVPPQRTPGLITLNKPLSKQQQQTQKRQSPKPRAHKTPEPSKRSQPDAATDKKHSPEKRGRQPKSTKPTARSNSHSAVRGPRGRQASPPLLEADVSHSPVRKSNLFDPFVDDAHPKPVRPAPTLASRPSGKLARRRAVPSNPTPANTPASTPPRAIPVPRRSNSSSPQISRSVPIIPRRNLISDVFPVCVDLDDADEDEGLHSFPATPSRPPRHAKHYDDGPLTAPIAVASASFPFAVTSSPTPAPRRARKHNRVPSGGVFSMSSDEESTTSSSDPAAELKAFFGLLPKGGRQVTTSFPESDKEREIAAAAAAAAMAPGTFFAGSAFQSSPSPEDLPAPSFV